METQISKVENKIIFVLHFFFNPTYQFVKSQLISPSNFGLYFNNSLAGTIKVTIFSLPLRGYEIIVFI